MIIIYSRRAGKTTFYDAMGAFGVKKNREGQAAIISAEMQKKIIKAMAGRYEKRDRAMFLLGLYSGMRRNEMRLLNVGDLIGPDKKLREEFLLVKGITKTHQSRTIYIHPISARALEDYLVDRKSVV